MLGLDVHRVTRVAMLADAVAAHRVGYGQLCGIVQRYGATSAGARCAIAGETTWPGGELGS